MSGLGKLRWRVVALAAVIAVVLGGAAYYTLNRASAHQPGPGKGATAQAKALKAHQAAAAKPVTVVSFSPALHAQGVNGADPVSVTFSQPLAAD